MKILVLTLVLIFLSTCLFTINDASAVTSILWDAGNGGSTGLDTGAIPYGTGPTQFTVTDTSLAGNLVTDEINVLVNSTRDPAGITLTLTESGDSGTFRNTNLIFSNGTGLFDISSSQTVGIHKDSLNIDPNAVEAIDSTNGPEGIQVFSTTDPAGIFMNLTETGSNTGIFTNVLHFTTGSSVDGSSISVHEGDIVSILDIFNGDVTNELVTPNPDPSFGAISSHYNDEIDAVYNGVKENIFLSSSSAPGGGGGGLIQPGLVLDILAAIGGSPFIVSPPSFGGGYHYSDGLTITQGTTETTFDISKYNQEIPKQVMIADQKVNMTFKTFEAYNPTAVIHMGLYIIPRGEDMLTTNSIASIAYDKNSPVEVNDPNQILSNASAYSTSDGKFQYTEFSFVPTKSYDKMSFLARAWNDHLYSTDVRVHDEIIQPISPKILPTGVSMYKDFNDLETTLEKDQFYKPHIMAHIHGTTDVFSSDEGGKVYWLYDTINHTVTLVIADNNDNVIASSTGSLEPHIIEQKGDYKFMKFTVKQLNRADEIQEEHAKEFEATRALYLALENGMNFGNP
jgi:hypothetical protein